MNNYRYDKLNMIIHLQHQKSHYRRIIEAKKNIDFKSIQQKGTDSISHANKYRNNMDRQRKQNNHKLVTKINQINNKNGLLQDMDAEARKKQFNTKYNGALSSLAQDKINRDNQKLAQRLHDAKPMVGTRTQWSNHFKKFKSYHRMIQKYGKDKTYDPQLYLRDTLTSLSKGKRKEGLRFSSLGHRLANTQNQEPNQISQTSENLNNQKQIQYIKSRRSKKKRMLKTSQNRRIPSQQMPKMESQALKIQINEIILRDEYRSELQTYKNRSRSSNQQI